MKNYSNSTRFFFFLIFTLLLTVSGCTSLVSSNCISPSNYIKSVYSSDGKFIKYELDPSIKFQTARIEFFAKRGMTLRYNTVVPLTSLSGTIKIPDSVFIPPAQRWFNFVVIDKNGCQMWGLVNEGPLQGEGNLVGIDIPTPGEGHAFVLR